MSLFIIRINFSSLLLELLKFPKLVYVMLTFFKELKAS